MHGPIGLEPYWIKSQGYSQTGVLAPLIERCFEAELGICAVTSEYNYTPQIPKGSMHDRLNFLVNHEANGLSSQYNVSWLGRDKNVFVIQKGNQYLFLVNSVVSHLGENGHEHNHLIIGTTQIPNWRRLEDTLELADKKNLISIATHPKSKSGLSFENIEKYRNKFDAIEGFDSQLSPNDNDIAMDYARQNNLPWIAFSNAHRVKDAGISAIEFQDELLNYASEETFIRTLKRIVNDNNFTRITSQAPIWSKLDWRSKLQWGIRFHLKEIQQQGLVD